MSDQISFERHFCVTVYVTNRDDSRFLFIKHKKLKKWLPPGGHVDLNELPCDAALRECAEETGLSIELIGERPEFDGALTSPWGIQRNIVVPNHHEHIDLVYLGIAKNTEEAVLNHAETDGMRWFTLKEIQSENFDTFPSIKWWCEKFSRLPSLIK